MRRARERTSIGDSWKHNEQLSLRNYDLSPAQRGIVGRELPCIAFESLGAPLPAALQERMGARHVRCMAFGGGRFYFYGQTADLATTLIAEIVVGGAEATATVKTTTGDHAAAFSDLLKAAL